MQVNITYTWLQLCRNGPELANCLILKFSVYLYFSKKRVRETNIIYSLFYIKDFYLNKKSGMTCEVIIYKDICSGGLYKHTCKQTQKI